MTPPSSSPPDATLLLSAAAGGSKAAVDQLLPLVYEQLRQTAKLSLASEKPGHTLSATVLVHEAYLKLVGPRRVPWANRAHFYAAAVEAMRRILLDHAKSRLRQKRVAILEPTRTPNPTPYASVTDLASTDDPKKILSFDSALCRLEVEAPDAARVVQLRFFAGLSVEETAKAMSVSDRTVNRLWTFARAWLHREISSADNKV